jgi:hypothetical protein
MAARLTTSRRQPRKFIGGLRFAPGANLGLGVWVVGVVEQLAARFAVRPINPGIAAAVIPIDTTLGGERVVFGAGQFGAFPAAGVLGDFLLGFALLALARGEDLRGLLRFAFVLLGGALGFALGGFGWRRFRASKDIKAWCSWWKSGRAPERSAACGGSILVWHHDGDGGRGRQCRAGQRRRSA